MSADPPASPLLHNLVLFARLLRQAGMRVTPAQVADLADSLQWIEIGNRRDFHAAARSLLVTRKEDFPRFDQAFDLFWRVWVRGERQGAEHIFQQLLAPPERQGKPRDAELTSPDGARGLSLLTIADEDGNDEEEGDEDAPPALALYSTQEALRRKDFSHLTESEIADARRFMANLRWTLTRRRSRRRRPQERGRHLDVRRSLRRSLRHGGELVHLAHRGPKMKRRRLVLLCDISGSMERYTRLLLHFLYSVEASVAQAEVFVFGTRLTRITRELRTRDPDAALRIVGAHVQDWSGGTRIGECLHTFNRLWARRVLGQGAIVLLISDGWDRGDPALLAREMERLQRMSYRLIWLNPLLGSPLYRPLTQGIQAALPYVDNFLPVHNLQSLESLAALLNEIQRGRPERRQGADSGVGEP